VDAAAVGGCLEKLPAPTSVNAWSDNTDDSTIGCLGGIQGLVRLNLRKSHITDAGVAKLEQHKDLQVLDLSYCKHVSDKGVAGLASLAKLQRLYLLGINLTSAGLSRYSTAI